MLVKKTRRMNDERKRKIGQWITRESWEMVYDGGSASGMVDKFTELLFSKLDKICPEETVKITKLEGKITSGALQKLARQRLREFSKHGNSERFKEIKKETSSQNKTRSPKTVG